MADASGGLPELFATLTSPHMDSHGWLPIALSLVTTIACCLVVAKTYLWAYQGQSVSANLVQSFPLAGLVACILILAIHDSLAAAIGSMGFLAMVRFRITLTDPRDMMF